jgi:sigma-B regulation protein RsbU (phosphoserine phosphatase)
VDVEHLKLTDFMDLQTLQEIQDNFAAVANVRATITDANGTVLTQAQPTAGFLRRQRDIAAAAESQRAEGGGAAFARDGAEYVAPIVVNDQRLGTLRMSVKGNTSWLDDATVDTLASRFGLEPKPLRQLAGQLGKARDGRPAAIAFLHLLANACPRLCYQEFQLRQRIEELTAVTSLSTILAEARDLSGVLDRTVRAVAQLMGTKAASIRLIDRTRDELVIRAVYNLSDAYLNKGPIKLSTAEIDQTALSPQGFEYVRDITHDPRTQYPQEAAREGIVSMLSVGMQYKDAVVGVLRVYTAVEQAFSPLKIDMLKAVATQAAAAIENARLAAEAAEAVALEKQVQMAADVQQRMIPAVPPKVPGLDLAACYVPCFQLGGDFYDFIPFPNDNVGLVVADVAGKGVPASLIMASVRAFLRAQVDNIYYLYEVVRRVNLMLCRDTTDSEFVTLFYGVLDARTKLFTYCNAGHPSGLVLREGEVIELASENTVLGIDPDEQFRQTAVQLQAGDVLLLYTDGLPDAMNFERETFGRARVVEALKAIGASADASADAVADHLLWEVRKFAGMARRTDDITMVVVRVE